MHNLLACLKCLIQYHVSAQQHGVLIQRKFTGDLKQLCCSGRRRGSGDFCGKRKKGGELNLPMRTHMQMLHPSMSVG